VELGSPFMLFGKKVFGFWLPFIGFKTYVDYDNIYNPRFKIYEYVILIQWVFGYGLVYKTEIEIVMEGDDWYDE